MKENSIEYELPFIVWGALHDALEKAIKRKNVEAIKSLREAVDFYNKEFIISGKDLDDLLNELESLKEKE